MEELKTRDHEEMWCVDARLNKNGVTELAMANEATREYYFCTKEPCKPMVIVERFKSLPLLWNYYEKTTDLPVDDQAQR